MTLEEIKKLNAEEQHTLNLEQNLVRQLRFETDVVWNDCLKKYQGEFSGPIRGEIITESNNVRRSVMNMLEKKCSMVVDMFNNDYENFKVKHGWYKSIEAKIRHQITRDELAYELCEVIRKVYYIYMEEKFPEKYKIDTVEKYLLKE